MALTPGTRLGPYDISALLGVGGMGEVYRARDTKLNRDVAIKVLPDLFASDAERLARFTREAQTLASLNHPHIAGIYGLEESGGITALVMELVEGEDLSQRMARGAIPLEEALPIAKQIAEALEAAHEQGIIHRDLKPANIKVRADGTVKVLDFGLAKAMEPPAGSSPSLSMSPTITTPAMTQAGIILGTAAYMSPEQARGKAVDKRADVWAFGCVLYEMLTGQRAFRGEDIADVLAAVLRQDLNWTALPTGTPGRLRRLLARCLDRDPKRRLRDIGEARVQIEDILLGSPEDTSAVVTVASVGRWQRVLPWAVAVTAFLLAGALALGRISSRPASPNPSVRLSADLGADVSLVTTAGAGLVLSPSGDVLAFVGEKAAGAAPQIYVRAVKELEATPLAGTDGARNPFFSPDGQWVAFFAEGKLKKVSVATAAVLTVCDAPDDRGGTWADDGTIVCAPQNLGALARVSSAGGKPEPLTSLTPDERTHRWPQVLPGGRAVLYTAHVSTTLGYDDAYLVVQPLPTGERKVVQRAGFQGRYLSNGQLVYMHSGTLFSEPFDLDRLEVTGAAVPTLFGVRTNRAPGGAQVAALGNGTLVYLPGPTEADTVTPISWMDRQGLVTPLRAAPSNWSHPAFSPDGSRLAIDMTDGKNLDVFLYEWARDTLTRLTFDPGDDSTSVWTPDGKRITFSSVRGGGVRNLYWQRADGTGEAQRLAVSDGIQSPGSWHPSGRILAYTDQHPKTRGDLMTLTLEGDEASGWTPGKPTAFLDTPANEFDPTFSPDGRWLAYTTSDASGRGEVFVRSFRGQGGPWQVSSGGGNSPVWSRTRPELLYISSTITVIMAVPYTVDRESFHAEKPRPWSERRVVGRPRGRSYDLDPNGERLAVAASQEQPETKQDKVVFVFNAFDELTRLATQK